MTSASARGRWRVLVVDDEQNLNWSLVHSLRKDGYTSDGALTGAQAQALLRESAYDCVISDVKMPGMDGFELLQWLRQHQPQARVIMMTAFGSPSVRDDALRGGVVAYLEKPFDLRALKDELQRLAATEQPATDVGEGYDLLEVVRVINLSRRDIALTVRGNGHAGTLCFVRGELHWAETESLRGDEAFLALGAARGTQMQPLAWDGRTNRNVSLPVSRLLYMALAQREGRSSPGMRPLPPLPPVPPSAAVSASPATPVARPPSTPETPSTSASTESAPSLPPSPSPVNPDTPALAASQPSPSPRSDPPVAPTSGPLMPPLANDSPLTRALASLGGALPAPNVATLLKTDGGMLATAVRDTVGLPAGAYTHLATATLAAARALLVADLGTLDELRITTSAHLVLLRRLAHGDRTALLVLVLPPETDAQATLGAIQSRTSALLDTLAP